MLEKETDFFFNTAMYKRTDIGKNAAPIILVRYERAWKIPEIMKKRGEFNLNDL